MKTRRPLCLIILFYALGIAAAYILSPEGSAEKPFLFVACGVAVIAILLAMRKANLLFALILVTSFGAGGTVSSHELAKVDPLARYAVSPYNNVAGENENDTMPRVTGYVIKVREKDSGRYALTVYSEGRNILVNVNGGKSEDDIEAKDFIGKEISFTGKVELPTGRRNPGTFDYALYLKTQGVRAIVKCESADIQLTDGGARGSIFMDAYRALCILKYEYLERARAVMPRAAYELFAGMMFGGAAEMDEESYDMFRRNGVAHILSVSGLHVTIVYAFFTVLFGRRRTLTVYLLIMAALVCYAAMSEFSPPVVRAVTMIGLHIVAKIFGKRYDLLTGVCTAAFAILCFNPLELFGVGFRLSFLAVLLLSFGMPFADRFIGYRDRDSGAKLSGAEIEKRRARKFADKIKEKAIKIIIPMAVIQLGMMPCIAYEFNYLSPSGFLLNPPVVAVAGWALPLGVGALILYAVLFVFAVDGANDIISTVFDFVFHVETLMSDLILSFTRVADALPFGHFNVVSPPAPVLFAFYGLLFFILSETRILLFARREVRKALIVCAGITSAALITMASPLCNTDKSSLVFVDVGQGDCLHIRTPDGRNYLVDGGGSADYNVGEKTLLPYLLKNGVSRLDGVFATHLHTDHWKGLIELSERMDIEKVYIYEGNRVRETGITVGKGGMSYLVQGDTVKLGENVNLHVLYPPRKSEDEYLSFAADEAVGKADENSSSLIMRVDYDGVSALMTGDSGETAEKALVEDQDLTMSSPGLHSRILKLGHHGSRFSTCEDFLSAVGPDVAVIQVGRNNYGHPTGVVLDRLAENDIMVLRNDLCGAIMFRIKNGKVLYAESCTERF